MYKVLVVPSRNPRARPMPMCEGCLASAKRLAQLPYYVAASRCVSASSWRWYGTFDYDGADDAESGTACAKCKRVQP